MYTTHLANNRNPTSSYEGKSIWSFSFWPPSPKIVEGKNDQKLLLYFLDFFIGRFSEQMKVFIATLGTHTPISFFSYKPLKPIV